MIVALFPKKSTPITHPLVPKNTCKIQLVPKDSFCVV